MSFSLTGNIPLASIAGATLLTLVIVLLQRRATPAGGRAPSWSTVLVYELGLFFALFVVLSMVYAQPVHDIQTGPPEF